MFYLIDIIRDENGDIIERRLNCKADNPQLTAKHEHTVFYDPVDRVVETAKVSIDGEGELFLEDDATKIAALALEVDIAQRIKRIEFGHRLVALMSIRNDSKSLTVEQIVQLVNDFSDINRAWLNGSIATSRALVDALTPDEVILTTADQDEILAEIDANLTSLGY